MDILTINLSATQNRIEKLGISETIFLLVSNPFIDGTTLVELMTEEELNDYRKDTYVPGAFAKVVITHPTILLGNTEEILQSFKVEAIEELKNQSVISETESGNYFLLVDGLEDSALAKLMRLCPNIVADILCNRNDKGKVALAISEFAHLRFGDLGDAALRGIYNANCTLAELNALKVIHDKGLYDLYVLGRSFYPAK